MIFSDEMTIFIKPGGKNKKLKFGGKRRGYCLVFLDRGPRALQNNGFGDD